MANFNSKHSQHVYGTVQTDRTYNNYIYPLEESYTPRFLPQWHSQGEPQSTRDSFLPPYCPWNHSV